MAKKKKRAKKAAPRKKKAAAKRAPRRRAKTKTRRVKNATPRKTATRKIAARKVTARKKTAAKGGSTSRRPRGGADSRIEPPLEERGLGPEAGGQSGDTEGLSREELAASESVEELLEEGQAFEAGIVSGVENAPDADEGEIRTREVPEDDVPQEYLDKD
jgi:hypothetical protein